MRRVNSSALSIGFTGKAVGKLQAIVLVAVIVVAATIGSSYYYATTLFRNKGKPMPTATPSMTSATTPNPILTQTPTLTPTSAPIDWKLVDLVQAVYQELVDLTTSGDGLEEIDVTLKSKSNDPLEVKIEPGTMFQAQSSNVQKMVVIEEKIEYLESPDDIISDTIDVACAAMDLTAPQKTDAFTISNTPTQEDLVKLLNLPAFANETFRIKQFAIWTITDNPPRGEYVGLGYFGFGSGPNDEEMSRIKTLFENAGVSTSSYQALTLVEPAPTSSPSTSPTRSPTPTPMPSATPTPIPKYSLSEAITAGYVKANITGIGLGTSSGDSITLDIQRLVGYTIEIEPMSTGTLLAASGDSQSMAVQTLKGQLTLGGYYTRDKIVLDTSNEERYLFSGYCVTFFKSNPTISTRFTMSGMADANVLKIYSILNQLPASATGVSAVQTAIFVVTDNISQSELQSTFPSGVPEIQNAITIIEKAGIDISTKKLFN